MRKARLPVPNPNTPRWSDSRLIQVGIAVAIMLLCAAAFAPTLANGFVDLDDEEGFVQNPNGRGLGWSQIRWAGTSYLLGAYQPIARIGYAIEYDAFGLEPWGYHLISVIGHGVVALLLWGVGVALLRRGMPSCYEQDAPPIWLASGIAAGLFAVHPLRTEVVAWAICQAYLPCAGFGLLTVWTHLHASESKSLGRRRLWRLISIGCFAASLGCYGLTLALPLVLLVIDCYPLRRLGPGRWRSYRVYAEKLPYLALSVVFGIVAIRARGESEGVVSLAEEGLATRIAQACHAVVFYIGRTIAPLGLRAVYARPVDLDWRTPTFLASVAVVLVVSVTAWFARKRWPAMGASWLAFLLILGPNSGLVRNATVLVADRYTYMASICGAIGLAAGLCTLLLMIPRRATWGILALGLAVALAFTWQSRFLCRTWHDSVSLWERVASASDEPDAWFEGRLGRALAGQGRNDEAIEHLTASLRLAPGFPYAEEKLGLVLIAQGRQAEAEPHFVAALQSDPSLVEARINYGFVLAERGQLAEAAVQLQEAVRLKPDLVAAQANLGSVLSQLGRQAEAEEHFTAAAKLVPDIAESWMNLGYAQAQQGKTTAAAESFSQAVRADPRNAGAHHNRATMLTQLGRWDEARASYTEALRLQPAFQEARRGLEALAPDGRSRNLR